MDRAQDKNTQNIVVKSRSELLEEYLLSLLLQVKEPTLFQFPTGNGVQKTLKENFPIVDAPVNVVSNKLFDVQSEKHIASVIPNQSAEVNTTQSMSNLIAAISDIKEVERIVLFFKDKTFSAYTPSK